MLTSISNILKKVIAASGYNSKLTWVPIKGNPDLESQICESCLKGDHISYGTYHLPKKDKNDNWIDHEGNILETEDPELNRYSCKNEGTLDGKHMQCMCTPYHLESIDARNKKMATNNPNQAEVWEQLLNKGLKRAIRDRDGKIYTGLPGEFHKKILNQIARIKPSEEEFLRNELLKDDSTKGQGSKASPYIGFVNGKGEWLSRKEVEEELNRPKSYAQLFHYSSITDYIKLIAKSILDPEIKNPLPAIREEAENIYQEFIASEEGKAIYEKADKKNFFTKVEMILNSLRPRISEASKNDPDKFQLLNAYLRDKISDGLQ
jgi:hypothetical protein